MLGIIRDITEQRKTEERLREFEAKYRAYFLDNQIMEDFGVFLKMMVIEVLDQLLRAGGWLDILDSEMKLPEQSEHVEKVRHNIQKIDILARQEKSYGSNT